MTATQDAVAADFEYKLQASFRLSRGDVVCAKHLIRRREILLPAILEAAERRGVDPVDLVAEFARGVHRKLCAGQP